jgi:hypothetical protein
MVVDVVGEVGTEVEVVMVGWVVEQTCSPSCLHLLRICRAQSARLPPDATQASTSFTQAFRQRLVEAAVSAVGTISRIAENTSPAARRSLTYLISLTAGPATAPASPGCVSRDAWAEVVAPFR